MKDGMAFSSEGLKTVPSSTHGSPRDAPPELFLPFQWKNKADSNLQLPSTLSGATSLPREVLVGGVCFPDTLCARSSSSESASPMDASKTFKRHQGPFLEVFLEAPSIFGVSFKIGFSSWASSFWRKESWSTLKRYAPSSIGPSQRIFMTFIVFMDWPRFTDNSLRISALSWHLSPTVSAKKNSPGMRGLKPLLVRLNA
ncbi:uncharacterized protein LOC144704436 [Wolffia australiana]